MQSNRLMGAERNAPPHFAGRSDERKMLRVLHGGLHGCPIMVVCAGLRHSTNVPANPKDDPHTISRCAI